MVGVAEVKTLFKIVSSLFLFIHLLLIMSNNKWLATMAATPWFRGSNSSDDSKL